MINVSIDKMQTSWTMIIRVNPETMQACDKLQVVSTFKIQSGCFILGV